MQLFSWKMNELVEKRAGEAQFLKKFAPDNANQTADLYVLRQFGTRIDVCEKNVGRAK